VDFIGWPEAPEDERPKKLPVDFALEKKDAAALIAKGWEPIDVRVLPNKTDGDRAEAVKAYLEGARLGTITLTAPQIRHLELEAKIYGLLSVRNSATLNVEKPESDALDALLSFSSPRAAPAAVQKIVTSPEQVKQPRKNGRPKGSKDKRPRSLGGVALLNKIKRLQRIGRDDEAIRLRAQGTVGQAAKYE